MELLTLDRSYKERCEAWKLDLLQPELIGFDPTLRFGIIHDETVVHHDTLKSFKDSNNDI